MIYLDSQAYPRLMPHCFIIGPKSRNIMKQPSRPRYIETTEPTNQPMRPAQ